MRMCRCKSRLIGFIFVVALFSLYFAAPLRAQESEPVSFENLPKWQQEMQIVGEVFRITERYSLNPVDLTQCRRFMFLSLWERVEIPPFEERGERPCLDRYSYVMPPDAARESDIQWEGRLGGVGMQVGLEEGNVTIVALMPDGAAGPAGVQAGDIIRSVLEVENGKRTEISTVREAVDALRGPPDTAVEITVERDGEIKTFAVVRTELNLNPVTARVVGERVGYIRFAGFTLHTADEMEEAVRAMERSDGIKNLIIDLRGNLGGLTGAALEIAFYFESDAEKRYNNRTDAKQAGRGVHNWRALWAVL